MAFVGSAGLHRSWPGPDPGYSWAGPGAGRWGWGASPAAGPPGRRAGLAIWAQTPYLPFPFLAALPPVAFLCQAASPCLPPPPSLPLCPLHRLVRALTCEIKRDFNYLSAKQQLERIKKQTHKMEPLANLKIDSTLASVVMLQTPKNLTFLIYASCSTNPPSHTYTLFASTFPHSRVL